MNDKLKDNIKKIINGLPEPTIGDICDCAEVILGARPRNEDVLECWKEIEEDRRFQVYVAQEELMEELQNLGISVNYIRFNQE
jgi:hypothetical protein